MYESHWQLNERPFENTADPRFYFPSESHQAALLKLRYAIENRRGGALLAGMAGLGKTLLANMLRQTLGNGFAPVVHLVFPQMSTDELLAYLADELDGSQNPVATVQESVRRIEHFLAENTQQGRHAVVIVDEGQLVDNTHSLEALRLLLNFETSGQPGLTLVLSGQPALFPMLERMPQLEERLAVKCLLRPFTQQETGQYTTHRLSVAGCPRNIFPDDAIATLHELTHGIPRRINRLCDLALLIGYAEERTDISAAELRAVSQELVSVVPE
jgi:type II secretory pathway predicted ATPase ExeA